MDKYYTPKIEEFYVGFEYEEYTESYPEGDWFETKITQVCDMEIPADDLEHNDGLNTRVKYLDSDDIKSLIPRNFIILQSNYNPVDVKIYINKNNIENRHFSGTIKNKSELNKIIKSLTNG